MQPLPYVPQPLCGPNTFPGSAVRPMHHFHRHTGERSLPHLRPGNSYRKRWKSRRLLLEGYPLPNQSHLHHEAEQGSWSGKAYVPLIYGPLRLLLRIMFYKLPGLLYRKDSLHPPSRYRQLPPVLHTGNVVNMSVGFVWINAILNPDNLLAV